MTVNRYRADVIGSRYSAFPGTRYGMLPCSQEYYDLILFSIVIDEVVEPLKRVILSCFTTPIPCAIQTVMVSVPEAVVAVCPSILRSCSCEISYTNLAQGNVPAGTVIVSISSASPGCCTSFWVISNTVLPASFRL